MKLLDTIIELLSDESNSLNAALLKTKVLLHTIGQSELATWVSDELGGYPEDKPLPAYRVVPGQPTGNIMTRGYTQSGVTLPTYHLPKELKQSLLEHELRQPMSVLEGLVAGKGKSLISALPPEICAEISKGMNGWWVQNGWVELSAMAVREGIMQVRSRLLDFVLSLRDKVGDAEGEDVKEAIRTIDAAAMFKGAVFGDNTTILVGSNNSAQVTNTIMRGDFATLAAALRSKGVQEADIEALGQALDDDKGTEDVAKRQPGPATRGWMKRMLDKAIEAAWSVPVEVAAPLLAEAIKAYIGS